MNGCDLILKPRNLKSQYLEEGKMKNSKVIILILAFISIVSASGSNDTRQQVSRDEKQFENLHPGGEEDELLVSASVNAKNKLEELDSGDQEASPSMTSVHHQVWTSSSSGSLDELSPEIIGRLRNDVPFLAAYALRPRLVGAAGALNGQSGMQPSESYTSSQLQAPSRSDNVVLQPAASSTSQKTQSLVPKLGDFSEFKVETSSTSKSEHHHKRKTVLKRKQDEEKKRKVMATARQLIKQQRLVNQRSKVNSKHGKRQQKRLTSKGKRKKNSLMRSQIRAGRLKRKMNRGNFQHHMNIIKHGRYQDQPTQSDAEQKEDTAINKNPEETEQDSGTKGGSATKSKKPFFSKAQLQPIDKAEDEGSIESIGGTRRNDTSDYETIDDNDDAPLPIPKRVGDDDVEEGGDTVTIMPKSDGVDDDPPVEGAPEEDSDTPPEDDSTRGLEDEPETSEPKSRDTNGTDQEEKPRAVDSSPNVGEEEERAITGGGGIGATTGAGSSPRDGAVGSGSQNDGTEDEDPNFRPKAGEGRSKSGVDNEDDDDSVDNSITRAPEGDKKSADRDKSSDGGSRETTNVERSKESGTEDDRQNPDDRATSRPIDDESGDKSDDAMKSREENERTNESSSSNAADESSDVDYRDVLEENERTRNRSADRKKVEIENEGELMKKGKDNSNSDCENGSYDHHADHHHHDGHHNHHDSIKWLQDAIPGKPEEDYPILSRINTTNFNCRDQKYPGFYADVESRCQVFHICQADGRQDSFLCPNGTIFSQISNVCVWWNSFDCEVCSTICCVHIQATGLPAQFVSESMPLTSVFNHDLSNPHINQLDAPKYYDLNALLYKKAIPFSSSRSPSEGSSDLRPSGGARIKPKEDFVGSDEESSIDSLIRAMRRSKDNSASDGTGRETSGVIYDGIDGISNGSRKRSGMMASIGSADEATIQRKSTNLDDDSTSLLEPSSRLRSKAEHHRKRRASARQAPPKLKSRRVSRNSRRRKLRHGIKPKRRA